MIDCLQQRRHRFPDRFRNLAGQLGREAPIASDCSTKPSARGWSASNPSTSFSAKLLVTVSRPPAASPLILSTVAWAFG
jgi:hypothetical protein